MATLELKNPEATYVNATQYFEMALSNRKLERDDNRASGICGLVDTKTGERFLIHKKHLLAASLGRRSMKK